jgi:hyperosmotically inducible protein
MRSQRLTSWIAAFAVALGTAACSQTDAGISTAVKTKLAADDTVKAYQIDVDTERKVVTLTGTVDTAMAKSRAVEIARNTEGVASVTDNIVVSATASAAPTMPDAAPAGFSDAGITTSLKTRLLADTTVGGLRIDVDTRDGVVTLSGDVKSQAEKEQALKLARETDGVKSVQDKLNVVP